jgi:hypothetical protein
MREFQIIAGTLALVPFQLLGQPGAVHAQPKLEGRIAELKAKIAALVCAALA